MNESVEPDPRRILPLSVEMNTRQVVWNGSMARARAMASLKEKPGAEQPEPDPDPRRILPLAMVEREHIERVMAHPKVKGRRNLAADLLGIGRTTLYRKLNQYRDEPKRP